MNINVARKARTISAYIRSLPDDADVAVVVNDVSFGVSILHVVRIKKTAGVTEYGDIEKCYVVKESLVEHCILIAEEF